MAVIQGTFAAGFTSSRTIGPVDLTPRGTGMPLPEKLRRDLEKHFATDFSKVRVYVDQRAAQLGASAITAGTNIYFAPGRYDPASTRGQQLIARELVHVMQQRGGLKNPFGNSQAIVFDARLEAQADQLSAGAVNALQAKSAPRVFAVRDAGDACCEECAEEGGSPCAGRKVPVLSRFIRVLGKEYGGVTKTIIKGNRVNAPRKASMKQKRGTARQLKKYFDVVMTKTKSKDEECRGTRAPSAWGWRRTMWDGDQRPAWDATALAILPAHCQICGMGTAATARDHIVPYRRYISDNAPTNVFCDGTCHYLGVSMADATTWSCDVNNLRPLCTNCNSVKATTDRNDPQNVSAPPTLIGPCPSNCPTCGSICL